MTPSQILASAGSVRAGPSGDEDIAAVTRDARVPGEPSQQLLSGEAAGAGDADLHGLARACAGRRSCPFGD